MLSAIAVRVCNKDRSPARFHGCGAAPTPTDFAEIVGDDIPNTSSYVERGFFSYNSLVELFFQRAAATLRRRVIG
jgi:hypothetical protein